MFFHYCSSAPVTTAKNSYSEFIEDLKSNKCVMPQQIQLPFENPELNNFEYLSSYLTICQNTKSPKRSKEAVILCKEIFSNLQNISCSTKTVALPDINIMLSQEVCSDINALKNSVPENEGSLLKRLTDNFLCDIMCDGVFQKACQVLLWSYEVRKHIASVNVPNNEQMSNASQKVNEENKNNFVVEAQGNESKLLNLTSKISQSETVLKNTQASGKISSTDITEPSKDEKQGNHLTTLEISEDHKNQNELIPSINIKETNSNLQENPSHQVTDTKIEAEPQERLEVGVDSNKNNELEEAENHNNLVSTDVDRKAQQVSKDSSVNLSTNKGLSHSDDQAKNNQGTNIPVENEQNISLKNAASNDNENIANEETGQINDKNDNVKNTIVNNNNETQTIRNNEDQNAVDTEINDEQTQKQGSENSAIARNEIEGTHKSIINNIDEGTQNQEKGNITDKTKNILTDQNPIPVKAEKPDPTVTVSEKTSLKADLKSSPKNSTAPKISIPNSELPSVATESSSQAPTEVTVALEKMEGENDAHQPAEKEPDQYTDDLENNGDDDEYPRHDYDGDLYNTKTRESNPDIPNTVDIPAPKEVVTSQQEKPMEFPSRDSFGQETNDIQMIAAFPEQEDSHFFFYFLSIVLILMAGYLIFHNKQKIIALIVEGRHERNRRSHRAGYKKLETK
ncbi:uncharacterized protein TNCT_22731 [Trichonephila clavata]|uniref:Uncharacterized protein n=1 Tax=Trichonephila clavata TaxID=2740835 RepID=A0A8X6LZX6_TRICU|nr:uncharacterized protein TNCT_22731 [Trichonephila clavata]